MSVLKSTILFNAMDFKSPPTTKKKQKQTTIHVLVKFLDTLTNPINTYLSEAEVMYL